MTKDRSNQSSASNGDFSLPRGKILRGRKNFQRLFEGDVRILRKKHVGLRYHLTDDPSSGCLLGFIVKKSLGDAHKRNHMKRLLREAYRLHQHILTDPLQRIQRTLHGAFMAHTVDASFAEVEHDVTSLLAQVRDQLPTTSPDHS
ncbi:ribonuclease P protein component [Fodinibius roseus]|uniref:Ribonuclease P protein component n=1 Tax=Fodinibius roseus TaxID=1194090 RepID=A0A1M4ZUZ2_9BACT|nr:ribonuclease P protein component [Fodinibius roseus]SHF21775.1 ribonuclease P protein component [Fodinibius roseus]